MRLRAEGSDDFERGKRNTEVRGKALKFGQFVVRNLFEEYTRESEGRKSEKIAIAYPTREIAIVTVAIVGLADDSLRGRRYRLEFEWKDGNWQLDWVGSQIQCWQGRGHQNWGRDRCF